MEGIEKIAEASVSYSKVQTLIPANYSNRGRMIDTSIKLFIG